jgi:hypothetical protein
MLDSTSSITYPHAIIATIYLVVREKSQAHHADIPSYIDTLIPRLLTRIITPAAIPGPTTKVLCSREIVHVVALIINAILREADIPKQNSFYTELFKVFLTGEQSSLIISNQEVISKNFHPLDPDVDSPQAEMTQVFVMAVAAARKEAALPVPDINHLLLQAADLATRSKDDPRRESLLKLTACILNKESNDTKVPAFVDSVLHDMWTSKVDHDRRKETLELISWVMRHNWS